MTVEEVFSAALARGTAQERSSYLDVVCGRDAGLRRQVDGLLRAHDDAGSFLERPAVLAWEGDEPVGPAAASAPLAVGSSVGPYALVRVLGEGGMGTVYEAEQSSPVRRRVALKVARWDAGAAARTRFEAERVAAARMDHPAVARVLDAGTTADGRAWFAMELFPGRPISSWCDERRLSVRERVVLALEVCRAVQHAHQKGVVHRDLKPGNVLVGEQDGRAAVKVIDFGVAKAVGEAAAEATGHTQHGQVLGTLRYMAPEQAEGDGGDVDTRADVYGLGAVLYELLTGSAPLDEDGAVERGLLSVLARVKEAEPPAPSARVAAASERAAVALRRATTPRGLVGQLRGELDWIVARCLEKDRDRRYPTADALAKDLERHLAGRAVSVGPPSAWYRTRKALRRHRTAAAVTGLSLAFLVAGGVGLGWVMRERSTRRAGTEREVRAALADADREQAAGRWDAALAAARRAEALLVAADGLGALRTESVRRREDLEFVARIDEIRHRAASTLTFGSLGPAYAAAFRALGVDVDATSAEEAAVRLRARSVPLAIAGALHGWAVARAAAEDAPGTWRRLVELARLVDADPQRDRLREILLRGDWPGLAAALSRDVVVALPADVANLMVVTLRTYGLAREAHEVVAAAQRARPDDFFLTFELGVSLALAGRPDEACRYFTAATALRPTSAVAHANLAAVLLDLGKTAEAESAVRRSIELEPRGVHGRRSLSTVLRTAGRLEAAEVAAREALELAPGDAASWSELARVRFDRKDFSGAAEAASEAVRLRPDDAETCLLLAKAQGRAGRTDAAIDAYRQTIRIDPKHPKAKYLLAFNLWKRGDRAEAVALDREAVLVEPTFAPAQYQLGMHLSATGDDAGAIRAYREAIRIDEGYAEAHCNLGLLLMRHRQLDEALAELRRGHELGAARPGWSYPSALWVADAALALRAARFLEAMGASEPETARAGLDEVLADPVATASARRDVLFEAASTALAIGAAPPPDQARDDRPAWRGLALAWLRRNLAGWPEPSPASDPELAERVVRGLRRWQSDRRLASVAVASLDRLPESERGGWRELWAEIGRRIDAASPAPDGAAAVPAR